MSQKQEDIQWHIILCFMHRSLPWWTLPIFSTERYSMARSRAPFRRHLVISFTYIMGLPGTGLQTSTKTSLWGSLAWQCLRTFTTVRLYVGAGIGTYVESTSQTEGLAGWRTEAGCNTAALCTVRTRERNYSAITALSAFTFNCIHKKDWVFQKQ